MLYASPRKARVKITTAAPNGRASRSFAIIFPTTLANSTSQVEYGLSPALGTFTVLDPSLVASHLVQLTGLKRLTNYYFRVTSTVGVNTYTQAGFLKTVPYYKSLVAFSNVWRYTTNNLDNEPWKNRTYNDAGWLGEGPALLYVENNPDVLPKGTVLPGVPGSILRSYYFRTHFQITGSTAGFSMIFTNFIDDGALLYLNGNEIQRIRMTAAPQVIRYVSLAEGSPISGDAVFPDVFRIGGDGMTNLVAGDNVLAAEVHQFTTASSDIVFGSALGLVRALPSETRLRVTRTPGTVCVSWEGEDLTLQQAADPGNAAAWHDVTGAATLSPYCAVNPQGSLFYRLRN